MATGFCQHCNQNVLLRRDDFDVCLAIILLIFTAGIGLIIYIVVYYSKPANRCIHCGSRIPYIDSSQYLQQNNHSQEYQHVFPTQPVQESAHLKDKATYCTFCGGELKSGVSYCPNCGSKI